MKGIRYRTEASLQHCYLYIEAKESKEELLTCYENRMLLHTAISGALPMYLEEEENTAVFRYDASFGMNLEQLLEGRGLTERHLRSFVEGLAKVLEELEQYLLPEEYLVLKPDLIFYNEAKEAFLFLLLPGKEDSFLEELRELFRWLSDRVDEESDAAILLLHRLSKRLNRERFKIGDLLQLTQKPDRKNEKKMAERSQEKDGIFRFYEIQKEVETSEETEEERIEKGKTEKEGSRDTNVFLEKATRPMPEANRAFTKESEEEDSSDIQEEDYELKPEKRSGRSGGILRRLPALAQLSKVILGILCIPGVPFIVYMVEGKDFLLKYLPLLLIVDLGIAIALIMDFVMNRMEE